MKKIVNYVQCCFIWAWVLVIFAYPSISWGSCSAEKIVIDNHYINACGYTQSTSFSLDKDTTITRMRIWYDTYVGGDSISATLTGPNGYSSVSGAITKGEGQWTWREAIWNLNQTLKAGTYTLTANSKSVCSDPSGKTTLLLYGCEPETLSGFQSIGATVTNLQFFEAGGDVPPVNERVFSTSFSKTSARYIFYQLSLSHPALADRVNFTLKSQIYRSDGRLYADMDHPISISQDWKTSWHVQGWGWENSSNWPIDTYTVKLFYGTEEIAAGSFSIVDSVQVEGIDQPNGVVQVDLTTKPTSAPVYMGNVVTGGNQMELSVNFPAYNKPVDIFIAIGLPDGRYYVADESGKVLNLESVGFLPIATSVAGTKTIKPILTPFAVGSSGSAFDPWPVDGTWIVYWLVSPDCNGNIWEAVAKENYELGFYTFQVSKNTIPDIPDTNDDRIVPDVVGKTQSEALTAITSTGLELGTVTETFHATVPKGLVISQNPEAGAGVILGSKVNLVISKGAEEPAAGTIIDGPAGTTISLPSEVTELETQITVSENTSADIVSYDEQPASVAVKINTGNQDFVAGNTEYKIAFPVTLNVDDPSRLRVMVQMTDGLVLPVIGDYNSSSKNYTIKTFGLANNWIMGVVSGNPISTIRSKTRQVSSQFSTKIAASSWPSLDYDIADLSKTEPSPLTKTMIQSDILPIARDVLITLQSAGFSAPLLQQTTNGAYEMYLIDTDMGHRAPKDASYYYPPDANLLGKVYIFYKTYIPDYNSISTWTLKNVIMHETFHAVQFGYKYRFGSVAATPDNGNYVFSTAAAYQEGTASVMGETYQVTGKIDTSEIHVDHDPSVHLLDKAVDDTETSTPYSKQDFFAFLAKRYFASEGLAYLHPMFGYIAASASGTWGSTKDEYLLMYRQGLDLFLASKGLTLPEVYTEYAMQRLYLHEPAYLIRKNEQTDDLFAAKTLAYTLLTTDSSYKNWESKLYYDFQYDPISFTSIKPLSSAAATLIVPTNLPDSMKEGTLPLKIVLTGGQINQMMKQEGVRILIIRHNSYGSPVAKDPIITVNDINAPIEVSLKDDTKALKFIIINSYIKNIPVNVTITVAKVNVALTVKYKGQACCYSSLACFPGYGAIVSGIVTDAEGNIISNTDIFNSTNFSATAGKSYAVSITYNYNWVNCGCGTSDCPTTNETGTVTGTITIPADASSASGYLRYQVDHDAQTITLVP